MINILNLNTLNEYAIHSFFYRFVYTGPVGYMYYDMT